MKGATVFVLTWSVCLCPLVSAAQDTAIYTRGQSQQGAALYASQCAVCHGAQLEGSAGPALTGAAFHQMAAAQHLTPKSLLDVVSTTMPIGNRQDGLELGNPRVQLFPSSGDCGRTDFQWRHESSISAPSIKLTERWSGRQGWAPRSPARRSRSVSRDASSLRWRPAAGTTAVQ